MFCEEVFPDTKETFLAVGILDGLASTEFKERSDWDEYDELKGHGRLLHIAIHSFPITFNALCLYFHPPFVTAFL